MFNINPADSTSSSFLSTEKLGSVELKLFDSIFSRTMKENNLVESSDFLNYEKGENEYIDNLIKQEATWTQELINNVINSIKILNKSNSAKVGNNTNAVSLSVDNPNEIHKDTINNANNKTVEVKFIKCTLTFKDEFGNSKEMSVNISLNFIEDYKRNNKGKDLNDLLSEISNNINKLSADVKNDLYNEIGELLFLSPIDTNENPAKVRNGYYNPDDNRIGILGKEDGRSIKDCIGTLIHELGHAVDDNGKESCFSKFENKFLQLRNLLIRKGLIPKNYNSPSNGGSYYPITDAKEFFAEIIYNDENGGEIAYRKLHLALTKDPEVSQLTKELKNIGKKIIKERRNTPRSDRIGIKSGSLKNQIEANEQINNAYSTLTLSLSDDLYDKYGRGHLDNLLKAYYEFEKNPSANTEGHKLINYFKTNYTEEWQLVEPLFKSHLEKQGLM